MIRLPLLLLAAALLIVSSADAAAQRTCRSGHTVYQHAGVRVFEVRGADDFWFACGPHSRRPTQLYSATGGYASVHVVGRSADKVLFEGEFSGEGGGEDTTIGWFDARTSEVRSGELAGSVSNEVLDVVVTPGGSVGVVAGLEPDAGVRVGYLAPASRPGALRGELALATADHYVKGSLAFADGGRTLGWKLAGGATRSVPVSGEAVTCTSGTTRVETDDVRVFEVLPPRKTQRGFQTDVLAACARGTTTPRELAVSDVYDQLPWEIRSLKRTGARVAFLAGATGVGVVDGAAVTVVEPNDIESVQDVAIGATGPVVFAGQRLVARTTAAGWERLAAQGGDLVDGSLAVGDDGRVTWRTTNGLAQSTPLAGETAFDCTVGTTLLEHDALRVFELLPAGGTDARLLACPPGALAPVPLLTGQRDAGWRATELARENGRVVIYAGGGGGDRIISFGATAGSARAGVPNASVAYGSIRDMAAAADGRIAVALRDGRRWRVTVFALGAAGTLRSERTIARPADGVRAGTLDFSAGRIVWRSLSGTPRSARCGAKVEC